jgi:hypothetical protein
MITLQTITGKADASGLFSFVATLSDGRTSIDVPVSVLDLQRYSQFQATVLQATGQLFQEWICDARPSEISDFFWREKVAMLLDR